MATRMPIPPEQLVHYIGALEVLNAGGVDYLVGGGFGLCCYVDLWRCTKDLDIFLRPDDVAQALTVLSAAGYDTELTDSRWLAKARRAGTLTDIIFCSYNGLFPVDDSWFEHARDALIFEVPVKLVAPEEMIVSKSFVAARDRFDGSDISWLLRAYGPELDWPRIERQFGDEHWQVLLWQLVHFSYVFPDQKGVVPTELMLRLTRRMERVCLDERSPREGCRGRMLDPINYQQVIDRREPGDEESDLLLVEERAIAAE